MNIIRNIETQISSNISQKFKELEEIIIYSIDCIFTKK